MFWPHTYLILSTMAQESLAMNLKHQTGAGSLALGPWAVAVDSAAITFSKNQCATKIHCKYTVMVTKYFFNVNLREQILVFSFMHCHSNQLSYPDQSLGQARILLLLVSHYPVHCQCHLSVMENIQVGITLIMGFYVNHTKSDSSGQVSWFRALCVKLETQVRILVQARIFLLN